jgi:hypothetical protein
MNRDKHSRTKTAVATAVLVITTMLFSGCLWAPELARMCQEIEDQIPGASFDRQFAITLGPLSLAFAKMVTAFIPDAKEARGYLRDVSKIQVAVYETEEMPSVGSVKMPKRLKRMQEEGWETAVRVREENNVVWVMYKIDDDSIRELYVVVLDENELVMVKARGRLERLAARALSEAKNTRGVPHVHNDDYSPWDQ